MIEIHVNNIDNQQKNGNFTALACGFKSEITALIEKKEVNAKSIMKASAIESASEIRFIINGEDEAEAANAISTYFRCRK